MIYPKSKVTVTALTVTTEITEEDEGDPRMLEVRLHDDESPGLIWLCALTQQRLTRIRKAFVRRGPGAAVLDADCGDIRAAIDAERNAA